MLRLRQHLRAAALVVGILSCVGSEPTSEPSLDERAHIVNTTTPPLTPAIGSGASPSAWCRVSWEGTIPPVDLVQSGIGIFNIPCISTNVDVVFDFSNTPLALPTVSAGIIIAVFSYASNLRTIRAFYSISPSNGFADITGQGLGSVIQDGNYFLVQASGVAAQGWEVRASGDIDPVTSMFVSAIAHGVEIPL